MSIELREEARRREEERRRLTERRERLGRDLRFLAETAEGTRFLRWLLEQGNIFSEDYLPGPMGAYHAGRKATAVRLWNLLAAALDPADFARVAVAEEEGFTGTTGETNA